MKPLTKSEYMFFLRHPAWLWLRRFEGEKLPTESAQDRYQLEQGNAFEAYAEKLFDGGEIDGQEERFVRLGFETSAQYQTLPERTAQAIADGAAVISQGRIEIDGLTCIVDILERVKQDAGSSEGKDAFNLYEIKASTSVKKDHEHDLAFQVHVLEKAGYTINTISVIHANSLYMRNGDIDVAALTQTTNITEHVRKRVGRMEKSIDDARAVIASAACPDLSPSLAGLGSFAEWITIYKTLCPDLPADSIYNLASPGVRRIKKLESIDAKVFSDIPEDMKLTKKQQWQISAHANGAPLVDHVGIQNFVSNLVYPIYFFDYETFSHIIPRTDGTRPYQQVTFQYSLHRLDKDGTLTHHEYLHTTPTNPVKALTHSLKKYIGTDGSVLVWYEAFEKGRNREMGEMFPELQQFYDTFNERIVDLMVPFSTGMYVDERFGGSASIKKVLPVLAPALSYKDLAIQEGASAQRIWMQTVFDDDSEDRNDSADEIDHKTPEEKKQIFTDLITYCTLDTYAMVEILRFLQKIEKE